MCSNTHLPNDVIKSNPTILNSAQPKQKVSPSHETTIDVEQQNNGSHHNSTKPSSSNMKQTGSIEQRVSNFPNQSSPKVAPTTLPRHYPEENSLHMKGFFDTPPKYGGKIIQPSANDVLSGRGGAVHSHSGNRQYRQIVNLYKDDYLAPTTRKLDKVTIAAKVVTQVRSLNPPGRFLEKKGDYWYEIGDVKARKKAGQAMRENGPNLRKALRQKIEEKNQQLHISTQALVSPNMSHQDVVDYSSQQASNARLIELLQQNIQQQRHLLNTAANRTILDMYGIEGLLQLNNLTNR